MNSKEYMQAAYGAVAPDRALVLAVLALTRAVQELREPVPPTPPRGMMRREDGVYIPEPPAKEE